MPVFKLYVFNPDFGGTIMRIRIFTALIVTLAVFGFICVSLQAESSNKSEMSPDTGACLSCHASVTPGIVEDWENSRHSMVSPSEAMGFQEANRRFSAKSVNSELSGNAVGCAECHTLNSDKHKDSFEHNGFTVHTVVSPSDCATCHPTERDQYSKNIMNHAYGNLVNNPLYMDLVGNINFIGSFTEPQKAKTFNDSCLYCHGTLIEVEKMATRQTSMGDMDFPVLRGWPNQGVGRMNPDGSMGACTSCHPRHSFNIGIARKPSTCSECHKGPDVPAYKVYEVSKHGNIYSSLEKEWDFNAVPWTVGKDFTAPTCAVCHVSEITSPDGSIIVERTHQMSDRSAHRLFGPIFATPHPRDPNLTLIKSPSGLPLPTDLDGTLVSKYFINDTDKKEREERMKSVCLSCHTSGWTDNHFDLIENSVETTNAIMLETNSVLSDAWTQGVASGIAKNDSIFNESIEKLWVEQWLFYANSTRFATAMGGADLGVFANGRWYMSKTIQEMREQVKRHAAQRTLRQSGVNPGKM
jgi:hydroxylamine dehydrogenase